MSKVIPESELDAAKKAIKSTIKKLQDDISSLESHIQSLPEVLTSLEDSLQTEGGYYITNTVSASIEELRQVFDKLNKATLNTVENISWTKETHRKKIGEKKLGGGEIN